MTNTLLKPSELNQRLQRTLTLSSRQMGWNGILVEQHDYTSIPGKIEEIELPALSDHWLILPMGHPTYLSQKSDDRWHESIFQEGDSLLVPAEQLSVGNHYTQVRSDENPMQLAILVQQHDWQAIAVNR